MAVQFGNAEIKRLFIHGVGKRCAAVFFNHHRGAVVVGIDIAGCRRSRSGSAAETYLNFLYHIICDGHGLICAQIQRFRFGLNGHRDLILSAIIGDQRIAARLFLQVVGVGSCLVIIPLDQYHAVSIIGYRGNGIVVFIL